jgi:hypothetical protein
MPQPQVANSFPAHGPQAQSSFSPCHTVETKGEIDVTRGHRRSKDLSRGEPPGSLSPFFLQREGGKRTYMSTSCVCKARLTVQKKSKTDARNLGIRPMSRTCSWRISSLRMFFRFHINQARFVLAEQQHSTSKSEVARDLLQRPWDELDLGQRMWSLMEMGTNGCACH